MEIRDHFPQFPLGVGRREGLLVGGPGTGGESTGGGVGRLGGGGLQFRPQVHLVRPKQRFRILCVNVLEDAGA